VGDSRTAVIGVIGVGVGVVRRGRENEAPPPAILFTTNERR
jgi:hypothetical protein